LPKAPKREKQMGREDGRLFGRKKKTAAGFPPGKEKKGVFLD